MNWSSYQGSELVIFTGKGKMYNSNRPLKTLFHATFETKMCYQLWGNPKFCTLFIKVYLFFFSCSKNKFIYFVSVDDITIPSKTNRGVLKRVTEVFDCWFESGR